MKDNIKDKIKSWSKPKSFGKNLTPSSDKFLNLWTLKGYKKVGYIYEPFRELKKSLGEPNRFGWIPYRLEWVVKLPTSKEKIIITNLFYKEGEHIYQNKWEVMGPNEKVIIELHSMGISTRGDQYTI